MCACGFCAKAAVIGPTQPRLSLKLLQTNTTQCDAAMGSPIDLTWGKEIVGTFNLTCSVKLDHIHVMCGLSVWEAMRVGPSQEPIVSDYKRQCWFLPYLFSLSVGPLGHEDMDIHHQKQHTWTAETFYSPPKRKSLTRVAKGKSVPNLN